MSFDHSFNSSSASFGYDFAVAERSVSEAARYDSEPLGRSRYADEPLVHRTDRSSRPSAREAIEDAAAPTLAERAAATPSCPCGTNHRAGSKIAIQHAALHGPKLAPVQQLPEVTGEDLLGTLSLLDGRLVVTRTTVRAWSPSRFGDVVPDEVADHAVILGLFEECGADMPALCARMNRWVRAGLPLSTALNVDLLDAAADLLNQQLAAEAAAHVLAA